MKHIVNLIERFKELFREKEFFASDDFEFSRTSLIFYKLDEDTILDISNYLKTNLNEAKELDDKKNSLKKSDALYCNSLNDVLKLLKEMIEFDYAETSEESKVHNWTFEYFVNSYILNEYTICVYNSLSSNDKSTGNVIYPLVSIRKHGGVFYCWNHLEGFPTADKIV